MMEHEGNSIIFGGCLAKSQMLGLKTIKTYYSKAH